jgi:DNA/RNA-binding domain of Phe-tRNA-synthetase-like protein
VLDERHPFRYAPEIVARYPTVVGGVLLARGLHNGPTPDPLRAAFADEQRAALARLGATPLSQVPALAAWRRVFRGFGVDPTQYRSSAEALLRRLTKSGALPSIDLLVDLGNLVSVRYALPVAIFDTRALRGTVAVRRADGSERFTDLGATEPQRPEPGEVIFADDAGTVIARRWCWRQGAESAARPDTATALVTVEGHHPEARADVAAALADLAALLTTHAGAALTSAVLEADHPAFGA